MTLAQIQLIARSIGGNVVVKDAPGYRRPIVRRMTSLHPIIGHEQWGVHNNSASNIMRAIGERVFSVELEGQQVAPPQPAPNAVRKGLKLFRHRLLSKVSKVTPLATEQFVCTYSGRKLRVYQKAAESLELNPLQLKDAFISAFIKDEKMNLSRKDDPCPRIIQPRSARFNIAIGKYLRPMEKLVYRGIAEVFGGVTVMKGLNADERGLALKNKWNRFKNPRAILLDAKRFDQHCNRQVIEWEHSLWESLTTHPEGLKILNAMRKTNVCYARSDQFAVKYKVNGGRMSGDMDTALGNCTTMCAMTWSFMRSISCSKFSYMNDGDDGVLIVEEEYRTAVLGNFKQFFLQFGFTMKLEGEASIMEEVEFCQARPIQITPGYWRFVRDPTICICKDSLTLRRCTTKEELRSLKNAIGWCGLALAGDVPFFGSFYRKMVVDDKPDGLEIRTGMQMLAKRLEPRYNQPTDCARYSFWLAYNITPDNQIALEHEIDTTFCPIKTPTPSDIYSTITNILHLQ